MGKAERLFALTVVGHHHAAIGLRADGVGGDALHILQGGVDDMTLIGVHGLQRHAAAVLGHLGSHLTGQTLQTLLPLGAVVLRVHLDADALVTAGVDGVVGQLLDGVQRFTAAANELTQLVALENDLITALLHLVDLDLGHAVHMLQQTGDKSHDALAEKLAEMEKRRGESRKARAKTGMPVVSLVGYTNVGKSSLMNALCGPSVAEADMLFATLDPTSRKLILPSGMAVLLVDTVGFVSRLPHNLVEAFKSTLEEAAWSDVIIRVADAGDEQREEQLAVTDEVLDGLDCADIPRLTVYNKCDKPGAMSFDPDILLTSAKTGYGLDTLLAKLDEVLSDRVHTLKVLLPYDKLGLAAPMRERGSVQVEEYREDGLYLEGIVKTEDLHCFEGYLV